MREFEIFTDSSCDLPIEYIRENKIEFARLTCSYGNKSFTDDFGQTISYREFFDDLRSGEMPLTSQPSVDEFYNKFKNIVEKGKDILYMCVSSGLSGTENSARIAKEMVLEENKDAEILIVNTLTASVGEGIQVIKALELKNQGKTLAQVAEYMLDLRHKFKTFMTVDDLHHLRKGGRLSAAKATLGIVLHVKPMLMLDDKGRVEVIGKARGRKASLKKLAETVIEHISDAGNQIVGISHGDCLEDAETIMNIVKKAVNPKGFLINYNGPCVATHGGPGNLSVSFIGK